VEPRAHASEARRRLLASPRYYPSGPLSARRVAKLRSRKDGGVPPFLVTPNFCFCAHPMLDLDDGHLDRSLLFLAAEYIEELEAALAKIGRALGNCT
jgi:hypothetical protein